MKAGLKIIEAAMAASRRKSGLRVKVRVPSGLWAGVRRCAGRVVFPAEEWVCGMCRRWMSGELGGVPIDGNAILGTREESETVWVRVPVGFAMDDLRRALAVAVVKSDAVSKHEKACERKMVAGVHFNVDESVVTAKFMEELIERAKPRLGKTRMTEECFVDELSNGHEVIPLGECDNFDFKTGCKGHPDIEKEEGTTK